MKKYNFILFIAVLAGTMISCSPAKKESKPEAVQQLKQVQQSILSADTSVAISAVPATTATSQPAAVQTASTPPELNPPHGQPFHRCDIPVGSPLNAAVAVKTAPVQTTPQVNRTGMSPTLENAASLNNPQANSPSTPAAANANSVKPRLNPPHGQPYHRCDIAVGSPLP